MKLATAAKILFLFASLLSQLSKADAQIKISTQKEIEAVEKSLKENEYFILTTSAGPKFTTKKVGEKIIADCNGNCRAIRKIDPSRTLASNSSIGTLNPTHVLCADNGGKVFTARGRNDERTDFCVFPDNSKIEVWSMVN